MPSIISATTTNGVTVTGDNSGSLQLATNNGTTAVTIDTSQKVGIGTASPSAKLHVTQSGNPIAQFTRSDSGTGLIIASDSDGPYFRPETSSAIRFNNSANSAEYMRIDSSGNLLVGNTATSGNAKFFVDGSVTDNISRMFNSSATPYGLYIRYSGAAPNNTGQEFLFLNDTGATRFTARSNGGLANYSANNVNLSDAREKTNIELAGNYLSKICSIPVKTFNYIDQNREDDDGLTLGVIAQDVEAIAPELVSESDWSSEKDGSKMRLSIYQTDLQYALMKAIQELNAKVDAQALEIQALKGVA